MDEDIKRAPSAYKPRDFNQLRARINRVRAFAEDLQVIVEFTKRRDWYHDVDLLADQIIDACDDAQKIIQQAEGAKQ